MQKVQQKLNMQRLQVHARPSTATRLAVNRNRHRTAVQAAALKEDWRQKGTCHEHYVVCCFAADTSISVTAAAANHALRPTGMQMHVLLPSLLEASW